MADLFSAAAIPLVVILFYGRYTIVGAHVWLLIGWFAEKEVSSFMGNSPVTPEGCFATLVDEFVTNPAVTPPQWGNRFGSSALKVHGKIFAMLSEGQLVLKLPRQRVDALIAADAGKRFDPRRDGRLMKEWVAIASPSPEEWLPLAQEALAFVASQR